MTKDVNKLRERLIQCVVILPLLFLLVWSCCAIPNAGTVIGVVLFGGAILCVALYRRLWSLIKRLWKRAAGKIAVILTALLVTAGAALAGYFSVQMAVHISRPVEDVKAVIVLGCRVRGETPSSMLWVRTRAAYDVLCDFPEAVCVLSSGQGNGESITEAEAMRRLMQEWGIAEERIIMEERSTSTEENLRYSAELLRERGVTDGIAISTSEFHQYRAHLYARKAGLGEVGHYSAGTSRLMVFNYWLREWAALLFV